MSAHSLTHDSFGLCVYGRNLDLQFLLLDTPPFRLCHEAYTLGLIEDNNVLQVELVLR